MIEPLVLGLLIAPSWGGAMIGLAAVAAFLFRAPLRIWSSDVQHHREVPRTGAARAFVAIYGSSAALLLAGGFLLSGPRAMIPIAAAVPFGLVQLWYDLRTSGRSAIPEILSPVAAGATLATMILAAGGDPGFAIALWALYAFRSIPSVLYVRARIRLQRQRSASLAAPIVSHIVALAGAIWIYLAGWGSIAAIVAFAILLVRAVAGLSPLRRPVMPKALGFVEVGYGAMFVIAIAAGFLAGF